MTLKGGQARHNAMPHSRVGYPEVTFRFPTGTGFQIKLITKNNVEKNAQKLENRSKISNKENHVAA